MLRHLSQSLIDETFRFSTCGRGEGVACVEEEDGSDPGHWEEQLCPRDGEDERQGDSRPQAQAQPEAPGGEAPGGGQRNSPDQPNDC